MLPSPWLDRIFEGVARPTRDPYARRVVYEARRGEVLLARWRASGRTLPHDHGGARGIVVLAAGRFEEQRFLRTPRGLTLVDVRTLEAPHLLVVGAKDVHAMTALSDDARSIHLYAGGARGMRVYDERRGCVLTLREGSGAWWPHDASCILRSEDLACSA